MKYTCIKPYPGVALGTEVEDTEFGREDVGNYPDYWQPVKTWEVLEFITKDGTKQIYRKLENGRFVCCGSYGATLDKMLSSENCIIHSVRNEKGDVFTVGDHAKYYLAHKGEITNFTINGDSLVANFGENIAWDINRIEKVVDKILGYTTPVYYGEEAKAIRKGDEVFHISNLGCVMKSHDAWFDSKLSGGQYFPTESAAKDYIALQKAIKESGLKVGDSIKGDYDMSMIGSYNLYKATLGGSNMIVGFYIFNFPCALIEFKTDKDLRMVPLSQTAQTYTLTTGKKIELTQAERDELRGKV